MATDKKPTSLTDVVLSTLAASDQPLSCAEIYSRNGAFENTPQIAGILNRLFGDKRVVREANGEGRFVYRVAPAEEGDTAAVQHAPAPRTQRTSGRRADVAKAAPQPDPPAPATVMAEQPKKPGYVLFDHIAHAMRDLDDLVADALDHGATPEVVKCVVASQGALRRAQEAIYREARAA